MNLIVDSINCCLVVYERWKKTQQLFNQKITTFKTYLKKLKRYLFDFEEIYRAFFFLFKLRFELKTKILDTNQVSQTRKKILKVVIMQKKNLKRTYDNNNNSNFNLNSNSNRKQSKSKNFKNFKSQYQQQSRQNSDFQNEQNK